MRYIYGVEKYGGEWTVWRFDEVSYYQAVLWVFSSETCGTVRWLCHRKTAIAMAGAKALDLENLIIWED